MTVPSIVRNIAPGSVRKFACEQRIFIEEGIIITNMLYGQRIGNSEKRDKAYEDIKRFCQRPNVGHVPL